MTTKEESNNDDGDIKPLATWYSIGYCGPYPIDFYMREDEYYYLPVEMDESGPFQSLEEAKDDARMNFDLIFETLEEAEEHEETMDDEEEGEEEDGEDGDEEEEEEEKE